VPNAAQMEAVTRDIQKLYYVHKMGDEEIMLRVIVAQQIKELIKTHCKHGEGEFTLVLHLS
jgi:tRNA threonylcarbamoyladenosine modification (KEOPS) complex Cgi121 subunit